MPGAISLPISTPQPRKSSAKWPLLLLGALATTAVLLTSPLGVTQLAAFNTSAAPSFKGKGGCEQAAPIMPKSYNVSKILDEKERIIKWLSGAVRFLLKASATVLLTKIGIRQVQIPTEVFDEMGPVDEDPRWKVMTTFQDYLEASFPLIHKTLEKSVHDWALVYEWPGSDSALKPLFLTAHQDVVPVLPSTVDQWDEPPYSGLYDGTYVHGRGSADTKGSLIAVMAAIEHLLETTDFKPTRTVVLGFGSDEERGGQVGAPAINKYLIQKYGKDSISLLIDEGTGLTENWGQQFGMPAVAEKGHFDLDLTVKTFGGHSSVPPPHTAIGYMSLLIAELEGHPHPLTLEKSSPVYGFLTCAANYAADMPKGLKNSVLKAEKGNAKALKSLPEEVIEVGIGSDPAGAGQGNTMRAMLSTTQATDIIEGGIKANALPEFVKTVINHRVDVSSNAAELEKRTIHTLSPVIKKYNLTLTGFDGKTIHEGNKGNVLLSPAFGYFTDPSPISPTDIADPAWRIMAGTARGMWASRPAVSADGSIVELDAGKDLVMAPYMSTGNTDTRRYWDLTRNIYRFRYAPSIGSRGAHTISEKTNADDVVELARFYGAIILTMDEATDV
ncbi:Gly-Xaa carboxypeptidase, partial [Tremellales sp. Uapishka_1]